jgi:hypothetical protein
VKKERIKQDEQLEEWQRGSEIWGEEGMVRMCFRRGYDPVQDMANGSQVGFTGCAIERAPHVAFMNRGSEREVLKPKELREPGGCSSSRVRSSEEVSVGAGASGGVAASHVGF